MSLINIENYEAFLLDYFEGQLSPELQDELFLFAAAHPELDIQLNSGELTILSDEQNTQPEFKSKEKLYKSKENLQNRFDELCFLFFEKTASDSEIQELELLKEQFPEFKKEFLIYGKTILNSEENIKFEGKELLKREFHIAGSFDELAVKSIENTINQNEQIELNNQLSGNPALQKELKYYRATVLQNEIIQFNNKQKLYKQEEKKGVYRLYLSVLSIAASLALLFGIFTLFNQNNNNIQTGIASQKYNFTQGKIRQAKINTSTENNVSENKVTIQPKQTNFASKKPPVKQELQISEEAELYILQAQKAIPIEKFELPSDYLSLSPLEMQQLNLLKNASFANMSEPNREFLSLGQFTRKQITKLFKKQNIDIVTPLENLKNESLSDLGMKSLEKVSRGKIYLEKNESEGKITGVHFFGLSYSRN